MKDIAASINFDKVYEEIYSLFRELAERVRGAVGYGGELTWDVAQPDGTPRKLLTSPFCMI